MIDRVNLSVSRDFGLERVTVSVNVMPDDDSAGALFAATEEGFNYISNTFKHYAANHLPAGQQVQPAASRAVGESYIEFPAQFIALEVKDGKAYYKIKGGNYTKHGVRVWEEVLVNAGIDVASMPLTGMKLEGLNAVAMIYNGDTKNPKKVTALKSNG